jgi:hypothetical protein
MNVRDADMSSDTAYDTIFASYTGNMISQSKILVRPQDAAILGTVGCTKTNGCRCAIAPP